MKPILIDLLNKPRLEKLSAEVNENSSIDSKYKNSLIQAVEKINTYTESFTLTPRQINLIYRRMNVDDRKTPHQMNENLRGNDDVAILRKKYYDAYISKNKFEAALREIVLEFASIVAGDILSAIINLVKNFSIICSTSEEFNTMYKDICFRFFTRHEDTSDVIVLILNIHFGEVCSKASCRPLFNFLKQKVRLEFFGAVVKIIL